MMQDSHASEKSPFDQVKVQMSRYQQKFQSLLDQSTPHVTQRWTGTAVALGLFMLRILVARAWFIVTYALFIYLLNLFLAFLQPKFDPALEAETLANEVEEGPALPSFSGTGVPVGQDEEFRPFIRRLPEFKFWYSATKAIVISMIATVTVLTDIPVFWPILLLYFCILFFLTMRRQIQHMIKFRYIPWDFGKATYGKGGRKSSK